MWWLPLFLAQLLVASGKLSCSASSDGQAFVEPGCWDDLEARWDGNLLLISKSDACTLPSIQLASLWNSISGHCRCSSPCNADPNHNLPVEIFTAGF